jgi:hypothetical protein
MSIYGDQVRTFKVWLQVLQGTSGIRWYDEGGYRGVATTLPASSLRQMKGKWCLYKGHFDDQTNVMRQLTMKRVGDGYSRASAKDVLGEVIGTRGCYEPPESHGPQLAAVSARW